MTDNLALWNRHRTPHKDALKEFTKRGGFKGTAIDPMWAIRAATEEWGPMGLSWGANIIEEKIEKLSEEWVLHTVSMELWYFSNELSKVTAKVPSTGSTWMVSPCKKWVDGVQVDSIAYDDEAPKKSRTDALTKALSWLGFGADIYMGMHDGSKYSDLKEDPVIMGHGDLSAAKDVLNEIIRTQDDSAEESERGDLQRAENRINNVKLNIQALINIIGEEKYKVWHDRVLSNFYGVDSIEKLSADELVDFADKQQITIKEHKE